jgi:hypothetical protein
MINNIAVLGLPPVAHIGTGPARPRAASDRLTTDDTNAAALAHAAYKAATARPQVLASLAMLGRVLYRRFLLGRAESHAERMQSALAKVMEEQVALANAGASEAEVLALALPLAEHAHALFAGTARRSEGEIDRDNHQAEFRESHCRTERLAGNRSPAVYRLEAEACRASAAVDLEKASCWDAIARRIETSRTDGRARVLDFASDMSDGGAR